MTPGVFVCAGCALWAARRASTVDFLLGLPAAAARMLIRRLSPRSAVLGPEQARTAIPILPCSDLERSAAFWALMGFAETGRYPGYLLLNSGDVELHFALRDGPFSPGECFMHVGDARQLWERVTGQATEGIGPIGETDYGLREFVATDPDGNRVRFGSPAR
jgi:catechol 2,3-dioxygenase-like lactoylglutathione lyase family enzyme